MHLQEPPPFNSIYLFSVSYCKNEKAYLYLEGVIAFHFILLTVQKAMDLSVPFNEVEDWN